MGEHGSLSHVVTYYVVVYFFPWFKFCFPLFLGMAMYDNDMKMNLKPNIMKFKPKIKLNPNTVADPGGPLFLDQTEARRAKKKI